MVTRGDSTRTPGERAHEQQEDGSVASTKREKELARMRAERQAARRAELAAKRRQRNTVVASTLAVLAVAAAVVVLATRGGDDTTDPPAAADPSASASAPATPAADERPVACGATAPPAPVPQSYDKIPDLTIDPAATYVETIKTSCGTITIALDAAKAPQTVNSFAFLAGQDFFDGAQFSRTTGADTGFSVLQGGDQEGDGTGGPGYTIPDENLEGATYERGTVAMANTGQPGSGGSQFFLVAGDAELAPSYTPFGTITGGLDVLDKIIALGNDGSNQAGGGKPNERVYIEDLTVTKQ